MKGLVQIHWRTALFLLAFGGATVLAACATSGHPDPRPGITAANVVPGAMLAGYRNEVRAYEAARQVPEVLDGLYCHCQCREHSGHRSLLTCFESLHGASCEICQREAIMAVEMHGRGSTLDQIRQAVDGQFRS
jgi:hypothetical protein